MGNCELLAQLMEYWCNEGDLGYDQYERWNIWEGGETDCSALALFCVWEAGYLPEKPTWGNSETIASQLIPYGFYKVPFSFEEVRRGDILVNQVHHVAIALGDGLLGQAGHDENWRYHGGRSGDQTGDETVVKEIYDYPWDFILRPPDSGIEPQPERRKDLQSVVNNGGEVYRVYNPNNGDHHYCSYDEYESLGSTGWDQEGVAWRAPRGGIVPIYRMYNPNAGNHMLTSSYDEADMLWEAGWEYEGVPFFGNEDGTPIYRLYNPNAGDHFFTASKDEYHYLGSIGWSQEGTAPYMD